MTSNSLIDLDDVQDLMEWAKGSRLETLRIRVGDRNLEIRSERVATIAETTAQQSPTACFPVVSPAAGRFSKSAEPGEAVEAQTVIGNIQLFQTSRPVLAGKAGRLESFTTSDGTPVEYGEVVALVSLMDPTC